MPEYSAVDRAHMTRALALAARGLYTTTPNPRVGCVVVKDGEIQVSGQPYGYFYTDKPYKNYVIRYSWTYPKDQPEKTTMNSGLLVHSVAMKVSYWVLG